MYINIETLLLPMYKHSVTLVHALVDVLEALVEYLEDIAERQIEQANKLVAGQLGLNGFV